MNGALALTGLLLAYMKPFAQRALGLVSLQCVGCLLLTSYFALTLLQVGGRTPGEAYGLVVGLVVLLVNVSYVVSVLWKLAALVNWRTMF